LIDGRIVATGDADLARTVEEKGFDEFRADDVQEGDVQEDDVQEDDVREVAS
jgi:hypothetical protein